jgi:type IV pilus assembly protein PilA
MRKMNKKGFTIVELVIVIAVIAILSAVLIPTFSGVVANARETAAVADAKAAYQNYLVATAESGVDEDAMFVYKYADNMWVVLVDGQATESTSKKDVWTENEFGAKYVALYDENAYNEAKASELFSANVKMSVLTTLKFADPATIHC